MTPHSVLTEMVRSPALADQLLSRFGTLDATLAAPVGELTRMGVEEASARFITLAQEARVAAAFEGLRERCPITSWSKLTEYLTAAMGNETREQFRIMFLDNKNQLILDEVQNYGTVDHAPVYPREVARRALEVGAAAIVLVHNHPSGDPEPSRQDIDMTNQVVNAMKPLKIVVHDHIIVAGKTLTSFRSRGLM